MMNKTEIDWCDFTWNPVTGCRHGCPYCYARALAGRFSGDIRINLADPQIREQDGPDGKIYTLAAPFKSGRGKVVLFPAGFAPTLHEYRLPDVNRKKKPATIFVCSMADLFDPCIPQEWIERVFEACAAAPWHNYMFLTKNPRRYIELAQAGILPASRRYWYGTTTPTQETEYFWADGYNTFASVEPILESFEGMAPVPPGHGWIIVGAETGQRKGKVRPERSWIEPLVEAARAAGVPILLKDSAELRAVWGDDLIQQFPEGLEPMPDNSVPHCKDCPDAAIVQQGKRGQSVTCGITGQHVLGRYTRSCPDWCPKRRK